jgi:N-acetylated-alpha-linked acidic dipeptidase
LAPGEQRESGRARLGYGAASFAREQDAERRLQESISADSLSALHRTLTRQPHVAGTDGSREVADHLRRTLGGFGLDVEVLEYDVFLSHPRGVRVEMVAPAARRLSVREPPLDLDPDTRDPALGDAYIAYSASGDVTAPVVYVNYGLPGDYEQLAARGVDVKGKIALARYARSHRAVKVHTAERAGASGVILYNDPADDGFVRGEVWPPGYWRGEHMPQRGNAKYSWFWHGDPLTPGAPAIEGTSRLDPATAPTLPRVPVAAIAWGEARHLLEALGGPDAPQSFQGGLRLRYRAGPGDVRARLAVDMDNGRRTIRNIVARVRGSETPHRMVLLGGHHDAWTFGGVDPGTGAAALLEVARALGRLVSGGWRPKRTIGIAFWDAEEFGLVGSTEFVEHKRRELQEGLIAYVNTDMYMKGRFDPGGAPSLRDFLVDVARDVPDNTGSVYDGWRASEWERLPADRRREGEPSFEVDLKALGSGADFVPFQDHLGVSALSVEFIGANGYGFGPYHSNFDTRAYVDRVADPGFRQGVVQARLLGTLAMRMAGADVLPFRFSHYARKLDEAIAALGRSPEIYEIRKMVPGTISEMVPGTNSQTKSPSNSEMKMVPGTIFEMVPGTISRIRRAAEALERSVDAGLASGRLPDARTPLLNDRLARLEQLLCDDDGDPATRWYRHVVYGWNIYSLYDGQPFPGLANALRERNPARLTREVQRIERALNRLRVELEEMAGQQLPAGANGNGPKDP